MTGVRVDDNVVWQGATLNIKEMRIRKKGNTCTDLKTRFFFLPSLVLSQGDGIFDSTQCTSLQLCHFLSNVLLLLNNFWTTQGLQGATHFFFITQWRENVISTKTNTRCRGSWCRGVEYKVFWLLKQHVFCGFSQMMVKNLVTIRKYNCSGFAIQR